MFLFSHALLEGAKNLTRSFWLSVTAIFVITVSLFSVALIASLWVTVGFTLRQFDEQAVLNVFLKDDVSIESIQVMENDIRVLPEVQSIEFINRESAREKVQNGELTGQIYDRLQGVEVESESGGNVNLEFFQQFFIIIPTNSESYNQVYDFVQQEKYVSIIDSILDTKEYIESLQRIYYWTSFIGLVLVLVFSLLSVLVMANMLRIAIYTRRAEIEIMRLVGATNNYIRWPFIAEGILYNLIAALIVSIFFVPSFQLLLPKLQELLNISQTLSLDFRIYMYLSVFLTMFTGLVVGGVTSFFATQKYLKL